MAPKPLLALCLLLAALLFVSSAAVAAAEEQVAAKNAEEQQKTVEDVKENFYKWAAATETAEGGVGDSQQSRFCPCCRYFRRRCAGRCCPNGERIPLDVEAEAEPHN